MRKDMPEGAVSDDLSLDADLPPPVDIEGDDPAGDVDDDFEVEHQGQVYRVPSALKDLVEAGANQARSAAELEQKRAAVDAHADRVGATLADRAQLHLLDQQIAGFEGVDWPGLGASNPEQARTLWGQYQQARRLRDHYAQALTQADQQAQVEADREAAAQWLKTGQELSRTIEGWSPQVAARLVDYARAFGVSVDELREIADPRLWRILHRAQAGDEARAARARASEVEKQAAVRPAVRVSGGSAGPGGVADDMPVRDWISRRNAMARRGFLTPAFAGVTVCAGLTSACASSIHSLAVAVPQIEMPPAARQPCEIFVLPPEPTEGDLDRGLALRGAQIVACDSARRLAVETFDAQQRLSEPPRPRWFQRRPSGPP